MSDEHSKASISKRERERDRDRKKKMNLSSAFYTHLQLLHRMNGKLVCGQCIGISIMAIK